MGTFIGPNCHLPPSHELETTRNLHPHESIFFEVFSRVSEFDISNSPFDRDAQNAHKGGRSKRQALNMLR